MLGCDLSPGGVSFARGVAQRWGVASRCAFVRDDARAVLRRVRATYPGRVERVVLSCPTPYAAPAEVLRAAEEEEEMASEVALAQSGNSQLPSSAKDPTFLGHAGIFDEIVDSLAPGGRLYLASNAEDVAVTLMRHGTDRGMEVLTETPAGDVSAVDGSVDHRDDGLLVPRRQKLWRQAGGALAEGEAWRAARPMLWASETERTYSVESRPVHRVVLRKRS